MRTPASLVVIATLVAALLPAAAQQSPLGLGKHDANAPIEVSANSFEADMNAKTGTYVGNVIVKQGDIRMRADRVRVNVIGGKPDKIVATGSVVLDAPSGSAQGDTGVYDVRPRLVTLTGRVVLTKAKNVMRGSRLVVNLVTGQAQLGAGGTTGGRVQGLFSPPPSTQPAKRPAAPAPAQKP
ncbi:MAG: lipopolysaccharide transport periplasmic protein LptA [Alphaproteobacteria bacterium]|nr:lipopolysaccharide transport periplasmic protein LptA [Alphaproteobacteria bacterium]